MARLVVLSEGMTGRNYELKVDKTTIGRVEDNAFHIPDGSVSSHHCEILLQGSEVIVKDLNSTNGTFINGNRVATQAVIRPGQTLRLGQVDLRFESGDTAPIPTAPKKLEQSLAVPRGVQLNQLDQGTKPVNFEGNPAFAKKSNKGTMVFVTVMIVVGLVLIAIIAYTVVLSK
jgi:pSer/pThr/pTyr-binding forkhead associated (FHA) protein